MDKQSLLIGFCSKPNTFKSYKQAYVAFTTETKCNPSYGFFFTHFKKLTEEGKNNAVINNETINEPGTSTKVPKTTPNEAFSFGPTSNTIAEPKLYQSKDIHFDDSILEPIKTGTIIDDVISISGGVMPATVTLVPGESGCGKTTLILYICSLIKKLNPSKRILFVSSEMNSIHIFKYAKRIDMTGMEIFVMSESNAPKEDFTAILKLGWDIVILDSLADTINKIRLQTQVTANAVENGTLKYLDHIRRGHNDRKLYTAFFCTHHMTKGGTYTGSTNLKHMTDAMMELRVDPKLPDFPFLEYSKNRDGKKDQRLYFKILQNGIEFNEKRFETDLRVKDKVEAHKSYLDEKGNNFDTIFLNNEAPTYDEAEIIDEFVLDGTRDDEGHRIGINSTELN